MCWWYILSNNCRRFSCVLVVFAKRGRARALIYAGHFASGLNRWGDDEVDDNEVVTRAPPPSSMTGERGGGGGYGGDRGCGGGCGGGDVPAESSDGGVRPPYITARDGRTPANPLPALDRGGHDRPPPGARRFTDSARDSERPTPALGLRCGDNRRYGHNNDRGYGGRENCDIQLLTPSEWRCAHKKLWKLSDKDRSMRDTLKNSRSVDEAFDICGHIADLTPYAMPTVLQRLHKAKHADPNEGHTNSLLRALVTAFRLQNNDYEFDPRSLATICSSLVNYPRVPLVLEVLQYVGDRSVSSMHAFRGREIATLAWGFAKMTNVSQYAGVFEPLAAHAADVIDDFNEVDVAITAWAFSKVDGAFATAAGRVLLQVLQEAAIHLLPHFNAQDIANCLSSFAGAAPDSSFFERAAVELKARPIILRRANFEELAMIAWAIARVELPLAKQLVFHITRDVLDREKDFTHDASDDSRELLQLGWAFARSCPCPEVMNSRELEEWQSVAGPLFANIATLNPAKMQTIAIVSIVGTFQRARIRAPFLNQWDPEWLEHHLRKQSASRMELSQIALGVAVLSSRGELLDAIWSSVLLRGPELLEIVSYHGLSDAVGILWAYACAWSPNRVSSTTFSTPVCVFMRELWRSVLSSSFFNKINDADTSMLQQVRALLFIDLH